MRVFNPAAMLVAVLLPLNTTQATEIIPFAGYRFGETVTEESTGNLLKMEETSSLGFMATTRNDATSTYDFLFSRQDTRIKPTTGATIDLTIDYYQIGGTRYYPQKSVQPFVSGGLGLTHVSPANTLYNAETNFSLSIGGGVKVPMGERIALRLEGRGYATVVSGSGAILCVNGGCVASFSGNLYVQFEALAGLSVSF